MHHTYKWRSWAEVFLFHFLTKGKRTLHVSPTTCLPCCKCHLSLHVTGRRLQKGSLTGLHSAALGSCRREAATWAACPRKKAQQCHCYLPFGKKYSYILPSMKPFFNFLSSEEGWLFFFHTWLGRKRSAETTKAAIFIHFFKYVECWAHSCLRFTFSLAVCGEDRSHSYGGNPRTPVLLIII